MVDTRASGRLSSIALVKHQKRAAAKKAMKPAKKANRSKRRSKKNGKGRKKVEAAAIEPVVEREVDPPCCRFCHLRLRDVALVRTSHCRCTFHITCIISYLESIKALSGWTERCPNSRCQRGYIDFLILLSDPDVSTIDIRHLLPYGASSGMPTKGLVLRYAKRLKISVATMISILRSRSRKMLKYLDDDERLLDDSYDEETRIRAKDLIDSRREKMYKRIEVLCEMEIVRVAGGMREDDRENLDCKFNFAREMERYRDRKAAHAARRSGLPRRHYD